MQKICKVLIISTNNKTIHLASVNYPRSSHSTPDRTPFEELNPGDVILFKEPKGLNTATDSIKVHIHPISPGSTSDGSTDSSGSSSTSDITTPDMPPEDEMHEMENIEYLEGRAILHRIVDIKASSSDTAGSEERILTTQGDHNPIPDRYPVNADAYLGKMIGCVDYVGDLILFLYTHFDLITVLTVIMSLMTLATALIRRSHLSAPPSTV